MLGGTSYLISAQIKKKSKIIDFVKIEIQPLDIENDYIFGFFKTQIIFYNKVKLVSCVRHEKIFL